MHYLQGKVMLRSIQSKDEQRKILQACHVNATAGHMGKSRTIFRIKGMVNDVKGVVYSEQCLMVHPQSSKCIVSSVMYVHVNWSDGASTDL